MAQQLQFQLTKFDGLAEVEDPTQIKRTEFTEMLNVLNLSLEDKEFPYTLFRRAPRATDFGPSIADRVCLGLVQYTPVGNDLRATLPWTLPQSLSNNFFTSKQYILAVLTDENRTLLEYKVLDTSDNTWHDITPDAQTTVSLPWTLPQSLGQPIEQEKLNTSFAFFDRRIFLTNGNRLLKWSGDLTEPLVFIKDKGTTPVALTGTLTFTNLSAKVTGSGTAFKSELSPGDWIRRESTGTSEDFVEVREVVDDTTLFLESQFQDVSGAGSAGDSRKAALAEEQPGLFITVHRDRLIMWGGGPFGSTLKTSIPGDPEDHSSFGLFEIDVEAGDGEIATGIAQKDEYLILFKRTRYYVYRHNPNNPAIPYTFVRDFPFGCISNNTIETVGSLVIYFTGKELRATNGVTDETLNNRMTKKFTRFFKGQNDSTFFFQEAKEDIGYPSASLDENRSIYSLCLGSDVLNPGNHIFFYDYRSGKCLGSYYNTTTFSHLITLIREDENFILGAPTDASLFQLKRFDFSKVDSGGEGMFIRKEDLRLDPPNKQKRIHYVEFELWVDSVDTALSLTGIYDFEEDEDNPVEFTITEDDSGRLKARFILPQKTCFRFGFEMSELNQLATQFGIASIVVAYEVMDTP